MKKLIPLLLTFALLLLTACGGQRGEPTTTAASVEPTATAAAVTIAPTTAEPTTAEPTTEAPTTEAPTTVTTTAAPTTTTTKPATSAAPTTAKPATTKPAATTKKQIAAPTAKKEIVALYNEATATAASAKPGYTKKTNTVLSDLNFGALGRMQIVRDAVGGFLGEGQTTKTVAKGKFDGKDLKKSTLTADDVTAATCTLSKDGRYYELTLTLKNETNPQKGSSVIGKVTEDYKGVAEIKNGITEAGASAGSVSTKTANVTVKAKIGVENHRFASLTHSFQMTASLTNVRYTIVSIQSGSGKLTTTVTYSDFKY